MATKKTTTKKTTAKKSAGGVTVKTDPNRPGTVVLDRWPQEGEKNDELAAEIAAARKGS
jgi:hypothetical protein